MEMHKGKQTATDNPVVLSNERIERHTTGTVSASGKRIGQDIAFRGPGKQVHKNAATIDGPVSRNDKNFKRATIQKAEV